MGTETHQVIPDGMRHALDPRNTFRRLAGMERRGGNQLHRERGLKGFIRRRAKSSVDLSVGEGFGEAGVDWAGFLTEIGEERGVAIRVVAGVNCDLDVMRGLAEAGVAVRRLKVEPYQQFGVIDRRDAWISNPEARRGERTAWWMINKEDRQELKDMVEIFEKFWTGGEELMKV